MTSERSSYRPDIDGLRAFSIIAVVTYHAFPSLLPGGFVGVDVFFVISGYLISGIILQGLAANSFSLRAFYRRRIQRIIPAVLLVLLFCLVAGWFALLPYEYAQLGKHTAAASIFIPNIAFWTEAGYFDTDSKFKPLLHLWSLGVEEQFYLIWPMLLLLAGGAATRTRHLIFIVLIVSFAASILIRGDAAASFFLPWFRMWELLLGAALAASPWSGQTSGKRYAAGLTALAGLALICAATVAIQPQSDFPGWWALLPTAGAALLIGAGPQTAVNRILGNRVLIFIGKISFPLYLWHWPLLSFARIMESGEPAAWLRAMIVALSVGLAWLSYRFVETPLRYHPGRAVPVCLLGGLMALGLAGMTVSNLQGIPQRTSTLNASLQAFEWNELGLHQRDDCSERLGVPGRCLSDGKPARIAVLGDSHSTNVFFALAHHFRDSETGIIRLGKGGCPPLYDTATRDSGNDDSCRDTTNSNMDWVIANPDITTVYLSSMGPMYLNPKQRRYRMTFLHQPELDSNAEVFAAALDATITRLERAGKLVVVVIDWPALGFQPTQCVNTRPLRLTRFAPGACRIPRQRYDRRSAQYRELLQSVIHRHPGSQYWDTAAAFCDQRFCYAAKDGLMLYRDPAHLSLAGSKFLGERLQLQRPSPQHPER